MMTQETYRARQALESLEEARSQVARMQRSVANLEERCTSTTSHLTTISGNCSGGRENLLAELIDRKTQLQHKQKELQQQQARLEHWIDLLPKPRWRMVLRYHYLEGLDLQGVCQSLTDVTGRSFSMTQIYRLHREALLCAEKLWPLPSRPVCGGSVPIESGSCPGTAAVTAPRPPVNGAGSESQTAGCL